MFLFFSPPLFSFLNNGITVAFGHGGKDLSWILWDSCKSLLFVYFFFARTYMYGGEMMMGGGGRMVKHHNA